VGHLLPGGALVLRAVDSALPGVLDEGVHDARIAAIDVEADAADLALAGEAARELRPGLAPVRRLPEPAAGAAAVVAERRAPPLVRRRVEGLRALRVHGHVHEAGVLVDELRIDPGLAAVRRAEEAALLVRSPEMAQGGD